MSDQFTCPKCGGHYFGRDTAKTMDGDVVVLETVRCHGSSSGKPQRSCDWRGKWPPETTRELVANGTTPPTKRGPKPGKHGYLANTLAVRLTVDVDQYVRSLPSTSAELDAIVRKTAGFKKWLSEKEFAK